MLASNPIGPSLFVLVLKYNPFHLLPNSFGHFSFELVDFHLCFIKYCILFEIIQQNFPLITFSNKIMREEAIAS